MGFIWFSTTAGNKRPVENKLVVELGLNKIEREHSCWSYRDRIRTREIVNLRTGTYGIVERMALLWFIRSVGRAGFRH